MKARILVLGLLLATGCAPAHPTSPRTYEGAAAGAVVGGVTGALLDRHNPWRGGVIGATIGAVAAGTLTEISERAAREAVESNHPVEYRTDDGRGVYSAQPTGYDHRTRCHTIHERVWEDGRLVKDRVKEICEGPPAAPPVVVETRTVHAPPPVIVEERTVYASVPPPVPGPPPWAPAHGRKGKHQYYYYPGSYVYFDVGRGLFFYSVGDKWRASKSLPKGVRIERTDYVVLEMDTEKPYHFHSEINRRYPPGHAKQSHKSKGKWDRD